MSEQTRRRYALGPLCALLAQGSAELEAATKRYKESNDRLEAVLGPDWLRELADRERGVPARGRRKP